jgi:Zinc finger, C3HC4 type (RING finger)
MAPKHYRDLPPPSQLDLHVLKTTQSMRTSLQSLHACLLCPLCNQTFHNPVTLPACAHSFCQECISDYACNSYECPVCALPIMLRGARAGKFDKTNPQIETVVSSFANICNALNAAPEQWWKEQSPEESQILQAGVNDEQYSFAMPRDDDHPGDQLDDDARNKPSSQPEEEIMEFEPVEEVMEHSRGNDINGLDEVEDESDDPTQPFPSPSSLLSTRSCSLPSQSPGCSVIAPAASQLSSFEEDRVMTELALNKTIDDDIVRNKTIATACSRNEKVKVVVASELSTGDRNVLSKLEKEGRIDIVETISDENVIAVCGNGELETGDGWLVGITFQYLVAMARGAEVMYATYFHNFPLRERDEKNRVIGIGCSTDWMGPQRAMEARMKGEYLLEGYSLIFVGEFDVLPHSRRGGNTATHKIFNKERIQTLVGLCGAKVMNVCDLHDHDTIIKIKQSDKVAFLIRPDPHARDWRAARKEASATVVNDKPIVCANWVLESLADYRCKDITIYTQTMFK